MSGIGRLRGTTSGLVIDLSEMSGFQEAHAALVRTLADRGSFLSGAKVALDLGALPLMVVELQALLDECREAGLDVIGVLSRNERVRSVSQAMGLLPGFEDGREASPSAGKEPTTSPGMRDTECGILVGTVRSGHSVWHPGTILVFGDVNPGAEVVAGGSVIVWGTLRGTVHAGASGSEDAVVCALSLQPTQLRIGDEIARGPDEPESDRGAEMARLQGTSIVVEEWSGGRRRQRRAGSAGDVRSNLKSMLGRVRRGVKPWGAS
ncbi:MAG: septum site-determining protein MinC [Anaerolineae bacterium]|nr:septum site-determining protein MinC [Anaerolineae bacterium]